MVFIPRDPVIQNQFLVHDNTWTNTATAGAVVHLSGDELVCPVSGAGTFPYGFLMQNVKAESSAHPTGFRLPGDLGSSDAFTGDPVGVAHLGIWDTTYYNTSVAVVAGDLLGVDSTGAVTPNAGGADLDFDSKNGVDSEVVNIVAVAQNSLDTTALGAGQSLRIKLLI